MNLRKGQIIYINSRKYTVINMIEFKQDNWVWQEYEIVSEYNIHKWLSIENDENNKPEYYIYDLYRGKINTKDEEVYIGEKKCKLYESGRAIVKDYFGNTDVDKNESCQYYDYISSDENTILSVEIWEDEREQTIGTFLSDERIKITDEIEKSKEINVEQSKKYANIIFIIFFVVPIIILVVMGIVTSFANKSMQKYLEKNTTKYTYVTSVTNNTNNKKAKVYKSSLSSIDSTVKDIIDGVPEGITKTVDTDTSTEEDGIGLQTNNEYAYIYEEDGDVYIQISSKQYMNSSVTTYHSHYSRYYYNSYTSSNTSTTYSNYASSARQSSINSRTSSGGGTSSGK